MFQSTIEFNQAIYTILKNVQNGDTDFFANLDLEDLDAYDALEKAVNFGYLLGVSARLGAGGSVMISKSNPRLSYEGLDFVEKFNK
ncbi:hypothetical protein MKY85_20685 [Paenibacillus sp. FSL R5-0749]|uniref:hypothetical protein n=1 Tax=Paenibacillus sp. FSL R5-0749 TaxID=2921657 RepID=UPI00315A82B2